jgi:hypothetical protein
MVSCKNLQPGNRKYFKVNSKHSSGGTEENQDSADVNITEIRSLYLGNASIFTYIGFIEAAVP